MRTEKQAWLRAAKLWDDIVDGGNQFAEGLCGTVWFELDVSEETKQDMLEKIDNLNHRYGMYVWSFTKHGARARAAFCRKQAALLGAKQ